MEKYRKFADSGTGVNPYLPIHLTTSRTHSRIANCISKVILLFLVVLRAPLIILWCVVCGIVDVLFMIPIISTTLVKPIIRPLVSSLGLVLLGVCTRPTIVVEDFRRMRMKRPTNECYTSGDVVFAPYFGFVDLLVHSITTQPSCYIFKTSKSGEWVVFHSLILAMYACHSGAVSVAGKPIRSKLKNALVFLHNVPSNGLGILKLDTSSFASLTNEKPFQIVKINYYADGYGPHHVVGSFVQHIFSLLVRNTFTTANVVALPEPVSDIAAIPSLLSRLSESCPETLITEQLYHDFLSYWNSTQNISYVR